MKANVVRICLVKEREIEYPERITGPEVAAGILQRLTKDSADESFFVLCVDVKNRITNVYEAARGGGSSVSFRPSDLFRSAILSNAGGIIVGHNHPSGDTEPSKEDIAITKRVKECCDLLGFRFLDSLIVTENDFMSVKP